MIARLALSNLKDRFSCEVWGAWGSHPIGGLEPTKSEYETSKLLSSDSNRIVCPFFAGLLQQLTVQHQNVVSLKSLSLTLVLGLTAR
jgi:hypothetical protein